MWQYSYCTVSINGLVYSENKVATSMNLSIFMQIEIDVYGILLDTPNKGTIYEHKIRSVSFANLFE